MTVESERRAGVATTRQAHCLRRHQAQEHKVSHERGAIPLLHCGALKDWHEYNKEIKSKVIRCECSKDTRSTNADSRAGLSEPGGPSRRPRCHNLVLEGDGCGIVDNDIGRVCVSGQPVGTKSCQTDTSQIPHAPSNICGRQHPASEPNRCWRIRHRDPNWRIRILRPTHIHHAKSTLPSRSNPPTMRLGQWRRPPNSLLQLHHIFKLPLEDIDSPPRYRSRRQHNRLHRPAPPITPTCIAHPLSPSPSKQQPPTHHELSRPHQLRQPSNNIRTFNNRTQ